MMTNIAIDPIIQPRTQVSSTGREKTQQVAAGVGGTAGVTASATRMAGKRGLSLQKMMETVTNNAQKVTELEETTGFWGKFKINSRVFTKNILKSWDKLQGNKVIGAVVKNPIVRKAAGLFGGVLAFFVLITELSKTVKNGKLAASDISSKFNNLRTAA